MAINGSVQIPPALNHTLVADVQAFEPYATAAFNRKLSGMVEAGIFYNAFNLSAGSGLNVVIRSPINTSAAINVDNKYIITVKQRQDITVTVPKGVKSAIYLTAFYDGQIKTNQVDATSSIKAAEIIVTTAANRPLNSILLGEVLVPADATMITDEMLDLSGRQIGVVGDSVIKTQVSHDPELDSKLHVPSSQALYLVKRLADQLAAKTIKHWQTDITTVANTVTLDTDALSVDNVYINGVRQSVDSAFEYNVQTKTITFAEPLMINDHIDVVIGAAAQDLSTVINQLKIRIDELEKMIGDGGGGGGGGGNAVLRIHNMITSIENHLFTIPDKIKEIRLLFIDGGQQTEGSAYVLNGNQLTIAETLPINTNICIVY